MPVTATQILNQMAQPASQDASALLQAENEKIIKRLLKLPPVKTSGGIYKRRLSQPRFKMDYATNHDIGMRLRGTIIFVDDTPWYVRDSKEVVKDDKVDFLLILEDGQSVAHHIWYSDERIDLRNPEPQYLTYDGRAVWMTRRPWRQQSQGVSYNNTWLRRVGTTQIYRPDQIHALVGSLCLSNHVLQWSPHFEELLMRSQALSELRLSPTVAFFRNKEDLLAEYKGRPLGRVQGERILIDSMDYSKKWITRDIEFIGCLPEKELPE
jgi:hypothetical protein